MLTSRLPTNLQAMEQLIVEICKAEDSNRDGDDISPENGGSEFG
jgi:hypothetical protein